jgi:hypothetical protein
MDLLKKIFFFSILPLTLSTHAAIEFTPKDLKKEIPQCKIFPIEKTLTFYKDPSFYASYFAWMQTEPRKAWFSFLKENPILFQHKGKISMQVVPQEGNEKNLILPVRICDLAGYKGTLGFVFKKEFEEALKPLEDRGMPPSVFPNPIPRWDEPPRTVENLEPVEPKQRDGG